MSAPVNTLTPAQAATFANGLRDRDSWPRQLLRTVGVALAIGLVIPGVVLLLWKAPVLVAALLIAAAAVLGTWVFLAADWTLVAAAVVAPVVLLALWRQLHRDSFAPVGAWLLGCLRCGLLYRWRWRRHTIACGLTARNADGDPVIPRLVRVISRYGRDELRVRLLPGQTPDDWRKHMVELAHAFKVGHAHPEFIDRVTVRCDKSGTVTLVFPRGDKLTAPVPRFTPPPVTRIDFERLPVARMEDGRTYRLPLLYSHVLVAGATGSGKGSALWSIMNALSPAIPSCVVQAWGIDPKGGMELALGRSLFHRLAYGKPDGRTAEERAEDLVKVMEDLKDIAEDRAARYAGKTRKFVPSSGEPFVVCIVDELAYLTSYMPFKKLQARFAAALSTVLTQGRAVGVTVVALLQDPRKETVPARNLFPVKIALRLDSGEESKMMLSTVAWERGAHCETIPPSLPGIGYVLMDGDPTPHRVRFSHITDNDVRQLAWTYPTPPPAPPAHLTVVPDPNEDQADARQTHHSEAAA